MHKLKKHHLIDLLEIIASIPISFYAMFISFIIVLIGIASLVRTIPFLSNSIVSQLLFILGLSLSSLAFITLNFIDKKKWPMENGKIIDYKVVRYQSQVLKMWRIQFRYSFRFNGKDYVKKIYGKTTLNNETEANGYSAIHSIRTETVLPVYIFKYYPRLSSISTTMNIFFLFYCYLVLMASSILAIFGFLYHIAGKVDITSMAFSHDQLYVNSQINKIIENYLTHFNVLTLILPVLVLVVIVLFIIKSLAMLFRNKMFFFQPKVDAELFLEKIANQNLTKTHCVYCNQKNDLDSKFCLNCGRMLAN